MEQDGNQLIDSKIDCPHCKKENIVKVVQIVRSEKVNCKICNKEIDLSNFNTEQEKNDRKNQKELDKLRKLLPPS